MTQFVKMSKAGGDPVNVHPEQVEAHEWLGYSIYTEPKAPKSYDELISGASSDTIGAIKKAIKALDEADFGSNGKPKVKAIEGVLGYDITAKQRDEAWASA